MASFEDESAKTIDKFHEKMFNLWKFKIEMLSASMDFWDIIDGSEEAPPSNADPKVKKKYERRVRKAMFVIGLNLADNQLAHIKSCGSTEAWKTLCNIHETKSLSNILFIRRKFFTCKMQEGEDVLDHINHVKALADQLACMEVPLRDEDTVMTLLESLPPSYEYLITALETKTREELTIDYVTARLIHQVSKRKEKDPRNEDAAMMLRQGKMDTSSSRQSRQDTRTCFYCGKPGHILRFCYKAKNKERENAKIMKDDADFTFTVQHTSHT
jgi:hypothetical protein